jgi:hypothetical protein
MRIWTPHLASTAAQTPAGTWKHPVVLALIIAAVGAFQIATIRQGHGWGDDFAMYIQQAKNLVSGTPSTGTGYIYNPHYPELGPPAYPPLYPVILAPVYRYFGLSFVAMKVEIVLCFLIALLTLSVLFASELLFTELLVLIAALGFSPLFWEAKDRIGSDLPFFALCTLALYLMKLLQRYQHHRYWLSALLGVVIYLSYTARTIGAVLLICLILYEVVTRRRISMETGFSALIAVLLIAAHSSIFKVTAVSYSSQFHPSLHALAHNLKGYFWEIHRYLWPFYGRYGAQVFTLILFGMGVVGYISRIRSGISIIEVFAATYTAVVLLWTSEYDSRFLIPVVPLWLYYILCSVRLLAVRYRWLNARLAPVILLALLIASYANAYTHTNFGPIREGIGDPRFLQACDFIQTRTDPGAVIVFAKPRLLALITNHPVAAYHQPSQDADLWSYFTNISAGYILVSSDLASDVSYLQEFISRQPSRLELVFHNNAFALYRIRSSTPAVPSN